MNKTLFGLTCLFCLTVTDTLLIAADPTPVQPQQPAQQARPARPQPPGRDPNTPGFVKARELPDGDVPPADEDGNFIIGPNHKKAAEVSPKEGVPKGEIHN